MDKKNKTNQSGTDAMALFRKEVPAVAAAFDGLVQSLIASKGLDKKSKQLIFIALKTASGDHSALPIHILMAKELGAKKEEILDAVLVTLTIAGLSGVLSALPLIDQAYLVVPANPTLQ